MSSSFGHPVGLNSSCLKQWLYLRWFQCLPHAHSLHHDMRRDLRLLTTHQQPASPVRVILHERSLLPFACCLTAYHCATRSSGKFNTHGSATLKIEQKGLPVLRQQPPYGSLARTI